MSQTNLRAIPNPAALVYCALAAADAQDRAVAGREARKREDELLRAWRLLTPHEMSVAIILTKRHGFDQLTAAERVLATRPRSRA